MKPFRFRLDRLRRLRNQEFEQERAQHDRACAICDELNAELRQRAEAHRLRQQEAEARVAKGVSGSELRSDSGSVDRSASDIGSVRHQLGAATDQRESQQDQLFAAWRRLRLLERLEARGRKRHSRAEARRDQQNLDEVGQQRWWGRNR